MPGDRQSLSLPVGEVGAVVFSGCLSCILLHAVVPVLTPFPAGAPVPWLLCAVSPLGMALCQRELPCPGRFANSPSPE